MYRLLYIVGYFPGGICYEFDGDYIRLHFRRKKGVLSFETNNARYFTPVGKTFVCPVDGRYYREEEASTTSREFVCFPHDIQFQSVESSSWIDDVMCPASVLVTYGENGGIIDLQFSKECTRTPFTTYLDKK